MKKIIVFGFLFVAGVQAVSAPPKGEASLVERFYRLRHQQLYWFAMGEAPAEGRRQLLGFIDSAAWLGLDSNKYKPAQLRLTEASGDESQRMAADRQYTAAALSLALDLYRGADIASTISYDDVSPAYNERDESLIVARLAAIEPDRFRSWLDSLEPAFPRYVMLKTALRIYLDSTCASCVSRLGAALNTYRWIYHFRFGQFIIANIPSATLRYYDMDTLALQMRIVAGETSKRTPRFAAWMQGVTLYPYWNIPHKIAVQEFLPLFKKSPLLVSIMGIQVLDNRGRVVDPAHITWSSLSTNNFPYTLRQAPGCENALGVLKFEISDPFDVYMHDTNLKRAFRYASRYLSHGCIRLEKPIPLGRLLLGDRLDTAVLNACLKDQRPATIPLPGRVPVFVVYIEADPGPDGSITWLKDIYHLAP